MSWSRGRAATPRAGCQAQLQTRPPQETAAGTAQASDAPCKCPQLRLSCGWCAGCTRQSRRHSQLQGSTGGGRAGRHRWQDISRGRHRHTAPPVKSTNALQSNGTCPVARSNPPQQRCAGAGSCRQASPPRPPPAVPGNSSSSRYSLRGACAASSRPHRTPARRVAMSAPAASVRYPGLSRGGVNGSAAGG